MSPPRTPPVGLVGRVGYGAGSIALGIAIYVLSASVVQLYFNRVLGIPAIWVGTAFLASLAIDAVADPLIGQWSDNFRSRLGRRHPFMYAAAAPAAMLFFLLWHAPAGLSPSALFAFSVVVLLAVRLALSFYEIPSNALAPELAPDYDKRTGLLAWRWFFLVFAAAAMEFLLQSVYLKQDASNPLGVMNKARYADFGAMCSVVIFVCILISSATTHSRIRYLHSPPARRIRLGDTLREVASAILNPSLLTVLLASVLGGAAYGVTSSLSIIFYLDLWGLTPQLIGLLAIALLVASILGVFTAPAVSQRFGKKRSMIALFAASLVIQLTPVSLTLLGLMPPNRSPAVFWILFASVLGTYILVLMGYVIISSMIADVAEDQAVRAGSRPEGVVFAANGLVVKLNAGVGAFLASVLMTLVHYPKGAAPGTVPADVIRHLAMIYLPTVAVLSGGSILVLTLYKIDRETHERNLERLREMAAVAEAEPPPL
ncbi:MFS transporter [Phenylobacterium sp.]|uniref:MFS transporter n=1 Tax=Phenylobacterium sp. TaxID=1871053 RepID=UPI002F3FED4C